MMTRIHAEFQPMLCIHRGAVEFAPENTIPALRKALNLGVSMVEVDVRRCFDGVLYNLHDSRVDRTTNGKGRLRLMRAAKVDRLDAGAGAGAQACFGEEFRCVRVPRVEDILRLLHERTLFYFDVKKGVPLKSLIDLVRKYGAEGRSLFWFRDSREALKLKARFPEMRLKMNASSPEEIRERATRYRADVVECSGRAYSEAIACTCRELGLKLMVNVHGREDELSPNFLRADILNIHFVKPFLTLLENGAFCGDAFHVQYS